MKFRVNKCKKKGFAESHVYRPHKSRERQKESTATESGSTKSFQVFTELRKQATWSGNTLLKLVWVRSTFLLGQKRCIRSTLFKQGHSSTYLHKRLLLVRSGIVNNSNIQRRLLLFHYLPVYFAVSTTLPCSSGKSSPQQARQTAHGTLG